MEELGAIGRWISDNESLLSGIAALVVLAGVILSPLGVGVRRLLARRNIKPRGTEPATTLPEASGEPLIAVLAFDNLSSDPGMQFFSDGVSEEIIHRLARGARLKVIGRTSSFRFRGEQKAVAAQELRCSHLLDGSIHRSNQRVRINAFLLDASTQTTLWSDRYDRELADIFAVQDEISASIATALDIAFKRFSNATIDSADYDLYLRTSPKSYAPDELHKLVGQLEIVTHRAGDFADAWGRLAYLRAFAHFYQPYDNRQRSVVLVEREAARALELDPECVDALAAMLFVIAPFGQFVAADKVLERIRAAPRAGDGHRYVGWYLRTMGRVRESLEAAEFEYRLNPLDNMCANTLALARLAAGQVAEAVPVYEALVAREPGMSFAVASLLRAYAFQEDWAAVDRLLAHAAERQLREFQETLPFVNAKKNPTAETIGRWRTTLEEQVAATGHVDVARLVYAAHLGLVEDAYAAADAARLGPAGTDDDIMGPDAYRTSLMFQADMPELRNDPRFVPLCARLGLVEFWMASEKWPDCATEVPYDFKAECRRAQHIPLEKFEWQE